MAKRRTGWSATGRATCCTGTRPRIHAGERSDWDAEVVRVGAPPWSNYGGNPTTLPAARFSAM
jgi:hypothetical protein